MALIDAGFDDPVHPVTRSLRAVPAAARPSFFSRLLSQASAVYCPMCGEELTAAATPASGRGRYCVQDHTRR